MATRFKPWVPEWLQWLGTTWFWRIVIEEYIEPKHFGVTTSITREDVEHPERLPKPWVVQTGQSNDLQGILTDYMDGVERAKAGK